VITAKFTRTAERFASAAISGHAGYADSGQDIVCAAVTSAVQLTANAITEVVKAPADVRVLENLISIQLPAGFSLEESRFLQALHLQLSLLAEDYPGTIQVIVSEV